MNSTTPDGAALAQIPVRFAAAWNRKDAEATFADYADDADFVNVFGAWWHGKERFAKEHADRFATIFAGNVLEFTQTSVREIPPNAAVIHAVWTLVGNRTPAGGAAPDRTGILVFVAERRGDRWLVVASQNTDISKM